MSLRAAVRYPPTPLGEQRGPVMPVTENTPRQLVLKSGSTTLTLDKDAGFGRRGLSHHAGPAHRRSLGTAGRGQKRRRDQCVCNPRLSGWRDLAPPSVGTLSAPTLEWVTEKFHIQEQLAGGVVR